MYQRFRWFPCGRSECISDCDGSLEENANVSAIAMVPNANANTNANANANTNANANGNANTNANVNTSHRDLNECEQVVRVYTWIIVHE